VAGNFPQGERKRLPLHGNFSTAASRFTIPFCISADSAFFEPRIETLVKKTQQNHMSIFFANKLNVHETAPKNIKAHLIKFVLELKLAFTLGSGFLLICTIMFKIVVSLYA
jgi:hypothetical protein